MDSQSSTLYVSITAITLGAIVNLLPTQESQRKLVPYSPIDNADISELSHVKMMGTQIPLEGLSQNTPLPPHEEYSMDVNQIRSNPYISGSK